MSEEQLKLDIGVKASRPDFIKSPNWDVNFPDIKRIVDRYYNWCGESEERSVYERDIISCFNEYDLDGYALAKHLESEFYIEPDARLVDILDDIYFAKRAYIKSITQKWVKEESMVLPDNIIGREVNAKQNLRKYDSYYITSVRPETYEVTIDVKADKNGGIVIAFENITFVNGTNL